MNRLFLVAACLAMLPLSATRADNYPYLTFQTSGGETVSVGIESLTITFADGKLIATDGKTTHEVSLDELSSMYFSESDVTGIDDIKANDSDTGLQVYSVSGVSLGTFATLDDLRQKAGRGVYVIKNNGRTTKIMIK